MDASTFRGAFPEFASPSAYPDARLTFVLREAGLRLSPSVWGDLRDNGIAYYAAHRLAVSGPTRAASATAGGATSASSLPALGIVTGKSVGGVSKSLDVTTGAIDGAGEFNASVYGREFASLAATVTAGAMQF